MVHGGMTLVKYLLFLFNFIFWLTGIGVVVAGTVIQIKYRHYINFLGHGFLAAPILLICIGVIIAILGFFGCCGAIRENYCMTMTFAVLLGVIFILELGAGVACYVLRTDVESIIKTHMRDGMKTYNVSDDYTGITVTWNSVQSELGCCGIDSYMGWENATVYLGNYDVPDSCCRPLRNDAKCGEGMRDLDIEVANQTIYTRGCVNELKTWVVENVAIVGGITTAVAFIQVIGLILACCFGRHLRVDYESF